EHRVTKGERPERVRDGLVGEHVYGASNPMSRKALRADTTCLAFIKHRNEATLDGEGHGGGFTVVECVRAVTNNQMLDQRLGQVRDVLDTHKARCNEFRDHISV